VKWSGRVGGRMFVASWLLCGTIVAQQVERQTPEKMVEAAQAEYNAGRPAEAIRLLSSYLEEGSAAGNAESHVGRGILTFQIDELLGLSYAALHQDAQALRYLESAVRVNPKSEEAHTNLAASLLRIGRGEQALEEFQRAQALAPRSYKANHNLGEALLQANRLSEGIPYLEAAQGIQPSTYDNGYDLAMAELLTKQYGKARMVAESLTKVKDTGELHSLRGQIEEADGKYVAAANEFDRAAHMDPSEENLFSWGSELMLHRTYEPAIEIFRVAVQKYPNSARAWIGLGISLYARGLYEDAVKALLTASDLSPADARVYYFLSKASNSSPTQMDEVIKRFERYAEAQPKDALAQYYYAMSLWKGRPAEAGASDWKQVEVLLQRAIALDDKMVDAHFQLGNLYADQHQYERSIPEYARAVELSPKLADAHYRLGTDYMRMGQKDKAQAEFAVYQKLRSEHMAESDKEGLAVQQFVYSSQAPGETKP
jgi:tetratricopeptide (TPR) repeat protein